MQKERNWKKIIVNIYQFSAYILIIDYAVYFILSLNSIFQWNLQNPVPQIDLYFLKGLIEYAAIGMIILDLLLIFLLVSSRREQLKTIFGEIKPYNILIVRVTMALITSIFLLIALILKETLLQTWATLSIQLFLCLLAIDSYLKDSEKIKP